MIEKDAPESSLGSCLLLRSTQIHVVSSQAELIFSDWHNVIKPVRPDDLLMQRNCLNVEIKRIESGSNTKDRKANSSKIE